MLATPSLSVLLNFLIANYLQTSRCLLVLSETNINLQLNKPCVLINIMNSTFRKDVLFHNYGCQDILIQTADAEFLDDFEEMIRRSKERFALRRYLIVSDGHREEFEKFFRSTSLKFIVDLLYVFPKQIETMSKGKQFGEVWDDFIYELWTHEFGGPEDNFKNPQLVDVWFSRNSSFLYNRYLYPDKVSDQKGKLLRIATITYLPYTFPGNSSEEADGTEVLCAKMYAEKHNMKIEMVVNEEELWGDVYENWTGNGILGEMVLDKSDLGVAAIYQWEVVYKYLEMSKPTGKAGVTCLVPAPRIAAGWLMPLFSFTISMWIAVGLAFFFSALYLWFLESRTQNQEVQLENSLFMVLAIFLLQSTSDIHQKKRFYVNFFMLCLLVTSLFIGASYSSGLASSMTIPRYDDPIRTVEDLARSGIYWGATDILFINSIENSEEAKYKSILSRFLVLPEQELAKKAQTHSFGFLLERTPFGHYAIANFMTERTVRNYNFMTENLYWDYCVIATRRNSVLLPSLDNFILHLTQSGLLHYLELKVVEKHGDIKIQNILRYLATHHDKRSEFSKLKWMHVQGAFGILAIGCGAAFICFIIELMVFKISMS